MQTITVQIDNVTIKGPFSKTLTNKKTGQTFDKVSYAHNIEGGGKTFTIFRNEEEQLESVGDKVNIAFEAVTKQGSNGNVYENNIIKKIEVLNNDEGTSNESTNEEASSQESKKETNSKNKSSEKELHTTVNSPSVSLNRTTANSKDISMEVSGIVQALLNTGNYHQRKTNEKGEAIYIADGLLETHVRLILRVKRKVAAELEQTGTV